MWWALVAAGVLLAVVGLCVRRWTKSLESPPIPLDVSLCAPLDVSLCVLQTPSPHLQLKRDAQRWGANVDAPEAGQRAFFPVGYIPQIDARASIDVFNAFSTQELDKLCDWSQKKAKQLELMGMTMLVAHCLVLRAYTEQSSLYNDLTVACRSASKASAKKLALYQDYLHHFDAATSNLDACVQSVYRGIRIRVKPNSYMLGTTVTWQGPSSASRSAIVPLGFLHQDGNKLTGTMFVIRSSTGKSLDDFSAYAHEEEVIFGLNSFFQVTQVVTSDSDKKAVLPPLTQYDVQNLDVYVLQQK